MIYSVKRDDMNFESKRVIMSSVSCRARRGGRSMDLPRHLPEPLSTATPLNQNMTDRSIPDAVTETVSRWLTVVKMIFISAHWKRASRTMVLGTTVLCPEVEHVIYRSGNHKRFCNLEFISILIFKTVLALSLLISICLSLTAGDTWWRIIIVARSAWDDHCISDAFQETDRHMWQIFLWQFYNYATKMKWMVLNLLESFGFDLSLTPFDPKNDPK